MFPRRWFLKSGENPFHLRSILADWILPPRSFARRGVAAVQFWIERKRIRRIVQDMSFAFFREFLRSPGSVGAMWPSSPALARRIVEAAGVRDAQHVLEIGPGTGAFTGEILNTMTPEAQFLAVEKSPALARDVAARFPAATVREGCATRLAALLKEESFPAPQAVVSGLPWAVFPEALQRAILEEIGKVVTPGSVFTSFAYFGPHKLPAGRRFRSILGDFFSSVEKTPVIYENFPPAFVYVCRK